jgi:cell wall-associated NlpC family hydrolase
VKRIQKVALGVSSAALCVALTTGCDALHDAPISNAKKNGNPAIAQADMQEALSRQADAQAKAASKEKATKPEAKAEKPKKEAKADPVETRNDMEPVSNKSDIPAWVTVVNWANSKVGHRYVWGGESDEEGGFDCSGLMQAAYAQAGFKLPRVANDQYATTRNHPSRKDLKMGDLVFYGKSERGIHHVGLYVGKDENGNAMMLHAPNSRSKIRYDKVDYMSDYYGATRVIP